LGAFSFIFTQKGTLLMQGKKGLLEKFRTLLSATLSQFHTWAAIFYLYALEGTNRFDHLHGWGNKVFTRCSGREKISSAAARAFFIRWFVLRVPELGAAANGDLRRRDKDK
jgi:hypothetical protein